MRGPPSRDGGEASKHAALKALRLNNNDANRAADALVCFLRDESPEPSAFGGSV